MDERRICLSLKEHSVFKDGGDTIENIINKDEVSLEIQESLLGK